MGEKRADFTEAATQTAVPNIEMAHLFRRLRIIHRIRYIHRINRIHISAIGGYPSA